ncbi:potassium transporter [bacterium]|nr:potassium transporter [bacterium]
MHDASFLMDVLLLLAAAVVVVVVFRRMNVSPVLGYLVAGGLIGPYGFGVIKHADSTAGIAEIGVVFLLFMIGLELSFERLRDMRRHVFGLGSMQFVFTGLLLMMMLMLLWQKHWAVALVLGFGLALSSTAIVLQVVRERGGQASQVGRLSLAVLLLQDLAVVPLLVVVPLLAGNDQAGIGLLLGKALINGMIVMVAIVLIGRLFLRPIFRLIASIDNQEIFVALTLLIVLGSSFATHSMGLSMALGAFLAGLLVAETEFHHQVEADIMPFKGLFLGLFFMTVGMQLDIDLLKNDTLFIVLCTLGLVTLKSAVLALVCRLSGIRWPVAIQTGLLLSQGGEFAFILFGLAAESKLLDKGTSQQLMVIVTMSMAVTPLLGVTGEKLARWMEKRNTAQPQHILADTSDLDHHVVLAGFGHVGQSLGEMLEMEGIAYVAIDTSAKLVSEQRKKQKPIYYGDTRRADVLDAVGANRASVIVFTYTGGQELARSIAATKRAYPGTLIAARAVDSANADKLRRAGASVIISEYLETSLLFGQAVLKARGVSDIETRRIAQAIRYKLGATGKGAEAPAEAGPSHSN